MATDEYGRVLRPKRFIQDEDDGEDLKSHQRGLAAGEIPLLFCIEEQASRRRHTGLYEPGCTVQENCRLRTPTLLMLHQAWQAW
jgi:hypothetical protein